MIPLSDISSLVTFNPLSTGAIVAFALAALLLVLSGFASGSEIAFFSLSPSDINELDQQKTETDKKIQMLREDSERTLATILITNNLVNVTIIMLLNYAIAQLVHFNVAWLEFVCITVLLTFLLLLFGEIMPKVYSRQDPLAFCRKAVRGIVLLRKLFWLGGEYPSEERKLRGKGYTEGRTSSPSMTWSRPWNSPIVLTSRMSRAC